MSAYAGYLLWTYSFLLIIVGLMIWDYRRVTRDIRKERAVSRKRMKTRHKRVRAEIEDIVSLSIETAVTAGRLKREDVNYWYKQFEKAGLKGLGSEPSYGVPWYKKVTPNMVLLKNKLVSLKLKRKEDSTVEGMLSKIAKRHRKPA